MAYEFHEYPKWVTPEGKAALIVNDADEEAEALQGEQIVREADERVRLIALAGVKDVQIDKRWGLDRITAAIAEAGHDTTIDPAA